MVLQYQTMQLLFPEKQLLKSEMSVLFQTTNFISQFIFSVIFEGPASSETIMKTLKDPKPCPDFESDSLFLLPVSCDPTQDFNLKPGSH